MRIAPYCRVSSDSDDQLHSYAAQIDYYTKLVGANPDWELVDIYADVDTPYGLIQKACECLILSAFMGFVLCYLKTASSSGTILFILSLVSSSFKNSLAVIFLYSICDLNESSSDSFFRISDV